MPDGHCSGFEPPFWALGRTETMPSMNRRDGTTVSWAGMGMCYCTHCEELFGSEAAFDKHLVRRAVEKEGRRIVNYSEAEHDLSQVVRNAKGIFVTQLMAEGVVELRRGSVSTPSPSV